MNIIRALRQTGIRPGRGIAVLSAMLLLGAGSYADQVILKNGSVFEGTVLSESAEEVELKISSGVITLRPDQIARMVRDGEDAPPPKKKKKASAETPAAVVEVTPVYTSAPSGSDSIFAKADDLVGGWLAPGVGILGGLLTLVLLFKPFFEDFYGFGECLKYALKPDFFSLLQGQALDDFMAEVKLYAWFMLGIMAGFGCFIGITRLVTG